MRKMKDSGIDWIDSIPEHWKVDKFKNKFSFGKGLNITKENLTTSGTKVISYGQIHSKANKTTRIDSSLYRFVSSAYVEAVPSALVCKGDIIFADTSEDYAGIGNCVYIDVDDEDIFAGYHTVIAHPETDENSKYLSYLFLTDCWRSQIRSSVSGIKVFSITQKILKQLSVILPPAEEQSKITAFLDDKCSQLDSIIDRQHQVIEKLNSYKLSVITEAVTKGLNADAPMKDSGIAWIGNIPSHWQISKVKYGVSKVGSGKTPKGGADVYSDSGVLFIRSQNVYNEGLALANSTYISEEIDEEMSNTRVYGNDVLLNITGGSIGRSCIYPTDLPHANVNQHVCIIRTLPKVFTPKYMNYFWISHCGKTSIDIFQTGANREGMNFEQINNTAIPYLPISEQEEITDYLDRKCAAIDESIAKRQQLIEKLTEYKKSLIFEVVTGKKEV